MAEARRSVLRDLRDELSALGGEGTEMLRLRWELARLELSEDFWRTKWLLISWLVALALLLGALPVLVVAAAEWLDGAAGLGRFGWLTTLGGAMVIVALGLALAAWWWFRRNLVALRETLAELEEDRLWLDEWFDRSSKGSGSHDEPQAESD